MSTKKPPLKAKKPVLKKNREIINATADINQEAPKKLFSGGAASFDRTCRMYDKFGFPYEIITYGGTREIHRKGHKIQRYVIKGKVEEGVGAACLKVLNDVRKFEESKGKLHSEHRTTFYKNSGLFMNWIMEGERDLDAIDVKACYWTIVKNAGIISPQTYDKYLDKKILRLVAIGNTNKSKGKITFLSGQPVVGSDSVEENYHAWVWNYVVYKAYELFMNINSQIGGNVFMFKTDCFYVAPKYTKKVRELIKDLGFDSTVDKRKVLGYCKGRIVMENSKKEVTLSNFGCSKAVYDFLSPVDVSPQVYNESQREERDELKSQPVPLNPLKMNRDFDKPKKPFERIDQKKYVIDFHSTSLDNLELTVRTRNGLAHYFGQQSPPITRGNIQVNHLLTLTKSQLLKIRNLGENSVKELEKFFKKNKLKFK